MDQFACIMQAMKGSLVSCSANRLIGRPRYYPLIPTPAGPIAGQ